MKNSVYLIALLLLFGFHGQAQSTLADELYEQAKEAYYDGEYDTAKQLFQKSLDTYRHSTEPVKKTDSLKVRVRLGNVARRQRLFGEALNYYNGVLEQLDQQNPAELEVYINTIQNRAQVYSKQYEPIRAIREFESLLPLVAQLHGQQSSEYANLLMNIGIDFNKSGAYFKSEDAFQKALAIFQQVSKPESVDFNRIYSNLGVNYRKMGDLPKALEYAKRALNIKLKNYPADHPSVAKYHLNIGKVLANMQKADEGLPFVERSLAIQRLHFPDNHPNVTGTMGELANVLADLGRYEEALDYYRAMARIDRAYMPGDHPYFLGMKFNIAQVYLETKRYDEALEIQQAAKREMEQRSFVPPDKRGQFLLLESEIYNKKGALDKALETIVQALCKLDPDFVPTHPLDVPPADRVEEKKLYLSLMESLMDYLEQAASQQSDQERQFLLRAYEVAQKAIATIGQLYRSYQSDEARRYLNSDSGNTFERAVRVSFRLFEITQDRTYLQQSFKWAEDAKANILKQAVNENIALRSANIPADVLDKLDGLQFKIGGLEDDLYDLRTEQADPQQIDSIQTRLFNMRSDYRDHIRKIERDHPTYFALKFAGSGFSVPDLQLQLKKQKAHLLSYFYDTSALYVFSLNQQDLQGFRIPHRQELAQLISRLRSYLNPRASLRFDETDRDAFWKITDRLAQWLIAPARDHIDQFDPENLSISPHGILHYLSFELLPAKNRQTQTTFETNHLLLNDYTISSVLTASLFGKQINSAPSELLPYCGFAPAYSQLSEPLATRTGWSRLHWNQSEVEEAGQFFNGQVFTGEGATETRFREIAPRTRLLHLAMHAEVNDRFPLQSSLAFSTDSLEDGNLNLYEIFNLQLGAETVVINACNTGSGPLQRGEGIMSLGYAFTRAGCQNLLFNRWLADDQATSKITTAFFQYLKEGSAQPQALRQAKLDYLDQADPLQAHPYFWAGMNLQTHFGSIPSPASDTALWWWLAMGLGGLLVGWLIFKFNT